RRSGARSSREPGIHTPGIRVQHPNFSTGSMDSAPTRRRVSRNDESPVAQAVGGALPLRDVVGDHAGRLHRRLAELGIAGNLALDALAFGMQQIAEAFE